MKRSSPTCRIDHLAFYCKDTEILLQKTARCSSSSSACLRLLGWERADAARPPANYNIWHVLTRIHGLICALTASHLG